MKNINTFSLLLLSAFIAIPYLTFSQNPRDSGLLLHFKFSGNAKDSSGNNKHGTVFGATLTTDRHGRSNSAYQFDGIDNEITFPVNSVLINHFTYSIWVNPAEIPGSGQYTYPFAIGGTGGGANIVLTNNTMKGWSGGCYNNGSPGLSLVALGTLPSINQWYHVVLVRDSFKIRLYVNGVLNTNEATYSGSNTSTGGNSANWGSGVSGSIGSRMSSQFFNGKIDDVRVYNRILSSKEINDLYQYELNNTGITSIVNAPGSLEVYPNPSVGIININSDIDPEYSSIEIYNNLGQKIDDGQFSFDPVNRLIDLSNLSDGVYFIYVKTEGLIQRTNIVLMRR